MNSQQVQPVQIAPVLVEARHPSGVIARAILPAWAAPDAQIIQIWLKNQRSDRTQETYAVNIEIP